MLLSAILCKFGNSYKNDFTNTGQPTTILTKLHNRVAQAITPAHYCANLIDPRYKGNLMSTEEIEIAIEYMNERYPDTMGNTGEV